MSETTPVILIAIGFLIVFPLFWMAIVMLIAWLSGWTRLARHFATDRQPTGEPFNFVSARFGFLSSYGNCLAVTVSAQGIHMQTMIFFRMGHKPLFIPWDAIAVLQQWKILFVARSRIELEKTHETWLPTITLYGTGLSDAINRFAPQRLKRP